ncbi:MAG: tyrosine-protein kinase domain-containing protein [Solirubrobacteraceae bacterium]
MQRNTTLADHLRVIRRHRVLIVLIGLICAGAALGVSAVQKKVYDATASVSVTDPNQALANVGSAGFSVETPLQLASIHASTVTRPAVLAAAQAQLHTKLSTTALKNAVTIGIDPNSYAVTIDASNHSATLATAIANAFAHADATLTTATARKQYSSQAALLQRRLHSLPAATAPATTALYVEKLSTLQSLASIAQPVQVASTATVPGSPTSPQPARNTIAGLIFGLLAGVAIAYLRQALDKRFRRPDEVEQQLGHPIVGRIRGQALGRAGQETRGMRGDFNPIDAEAFRILRHNVQYLSAADAARVLLVTSAAAQEGKSTVAACLALASAEAGTRTMLVECDLRRPVLAARLGLAHAPGLSDYLAGMAAPEQIVQAVGPPHSQNGAEHAPSLGAARLICVTAGTPPPSPSDLLASDRFRQFIAEVSSVYDTVILDCAPLLSVADTLEIVPSASAVLVCVRLGKTTRDQARSAQEALSRIPGRPVGLVLTDVRGIEDEYYGYYHRDLSTAVTA